MGVDHYENFPVASILMPARLRSAVKAIYRFARTADDLADEGDAPARQRLTQLQGLYTQLDAIEAGQPSDWPELAQIIGQYRLPIGLFRDLLSAFMQDVTTLRYASQADVLDYCRRSANPVGRLMLHLFGRTDVQSFAWSDAICTGLQLANFLQDVAIDWHKGRLYLPQEALAQHGVTEQSIAHYIRMGSSATPIIGREAHTAWAGLMREHCRMTATLLRQGTPLPRVLGGRVGFELRIVIQGGLRILERIDAVQGDVFAHRPSLGTFDWIILLWRALTLHASPSPKSLAHDA
ncbi:MAG TPA: squalene synthase HpnC [Burkholderiaceae bacterium]|nr:squalene synthase HpnC [Burkholderiaceae bacterium]